MRYCSLESIIPLAVATGVMIAHAPPARLVARFKSCRAFGLPHLCLSYTEPLARVATGSFGCHSFPLIANRRLSSRPRRQSGQIEPPSCLWLEGGVQRANGVDEPLGHHAGQMRMHRCC